MQPNVGTVDARIRLVLAAVFFVVSVAFNHLALVALLAALVALLMAGTALTRSCPLYGALHITTIPKRPHDPRPRGRDGIVTHR